MVNSYTTVTPYVLDPILHVIFLTLFIEVTIMSCDPGMTGSHQPKCA